MPTPRRRAPERWIKYISAEKTGQVIKCMDACLACRLGLVHRNTRLTKAYLVYMFPYFYMAQPRRSSRGRSAVMHRPQHERDKRQWYQSALILEATPAPSRRRDTGTVTDNWNTCSRSCIDSSKEERYSYRPWWERHSYRSWREILAVAH